VDDRLCERLFKEAEASNTVWEYLQSIGVHELQHANQYIDMARVRLATEDIGDVAAHLGIPEKAVEAAERLGKLKPGMGGYEEATRIYESLFGTTDPVLNKATRDQVINDLFRYKGQQDALADAIGECEKLSKEMSDAEKAGATVDVVDEIEERVGVAKRRADAAERTVKDNAAAREETYQKYRNLPEEQEAWDVQEKYQHHLGAKRQSEELARVKAELEAQLEAARKAARERPLGAGGRKPDGTFDMADESGSWDSDLDPLRARR
jgi:hypothetical protein